MFEIVLLGNPRLWDNELMATFMERTGTVFIEPVFLCRSISVVYCVIKSLHSEIVWKDVFFNF